MAEKPYDRLDGVILRLEESRYSSGRLLILRSGLLQPSFRSLRWQLNTSLHTIT